MLIAITLSTLAWFILAALLFFNPIVDKIYASEENHPAVRALPKVPATITKILAAVLLQCALWAVVYVTIKPALPADFTLRILYFGTLILVMKMIPRDIDRLLLTTYPVKRMGIEFVIGAICGYPVAAVFAYFFE